MKKLKNLLSMKIDKKKLAKSLKEPKINFIYKNIKDIKRPKILEFGVRDGISTNLFLSICEMNNGNLISVDVDDCSRLFDNKRWKFFQTRDDNFNFIKKRIKKLDVINIDSYHEPNHIKKLIYYYFKYLKINGIIFIDDISWLPYVKNSYRPNSFNEITNKRTFNKLLEIYFSNIKNIDLEISFANSGTVMITKKKNKKLQEPDKIISSENNLKNIMKKIYMRKPKK